jgi:fatty acid kinase fatty acid binding subunit
VNLTAENTAIVLDSTADFPDAPSRFPNWRVVPLYVRFGDESFRDYVELGPDAFYDRLRQTDELPTTSQPTPQDFLAVYEELGAYERILSLHIASNLSGTFASAGLAAQELGGDRVRLHDSRTASAATAMLGLAIQRRLERGTTDEELEALVAGYAREAHLLFTVDTLEFLAKGGRIGRARALAGQLLNVKPVLTIDDGEVVPLTRVRGWQKAMAEFGKRFTESVDGATGLRVGIAHAQAPERVTALEELVRNLRPDAEIEHVTTLGAVVGTHAGPGTVGLFWYADSVGPT